MRRAAAGEKLAEHTDPGILTVKRVSEVPGVKVFDRSAPGCEGEGNFARQGAWVDIESLASTDDILVWAGDQLGAAAKNDGCRVRAVDHRVDTPISVERSSFVYELRVPETMHSQLCRHGRSAAECGACRYYPVG